MKDKITLTKKQAVRALMYLEELDSLILEQLWDNHHPFGADGKRELKRLRASIRTKLERLTKRVADGERAARQNPFAEHVAAFKSRRR